MADPPQLPTRFVSQSEIESTNAKKEEAWRAAYARIGQEPPVREVDEKYDGRSLAEKLAANRAAKQEEFENSHKLSAQFRSLDPDEITFLDEVAVRRMEEDRRVKEGDEEALRGFRAAVQAREIAPPIPGPGPGPSSTSPTLLKSHSDTLPTMGSGASVASTSASARTKSPIQPSSKSPNSPPAVNKSTSPTNKSTSKHPQSPTSKQPQTPTSKQPQAPGPAPQQPPPTKTRSIKAGLKGVVVQRKRSKAGGGGAAAPATVEFAAGRSVEGPVGGSSKLGRGDGDGDGEAAGGDKKRRRVE